MSTLLTKRSRLPFTISPLTAEDMPQFVRLFPIRLSHSCRLIHSLSTQAEGQLTAFGERMYDVLEPPEVRTHPEIRYRRFAARHLPLLKFPSERPMKAVVTETDGQQKIAGVAWWHVPGSAIDNRQKRNVERMSEETEEEKESWRDFNWEKWNEMLGG